MPNTLNKKCEAGPSAKQSRHLAKPKRGFTPNPT